MVLENYTSSNPSMLHVMLLISEAPIVFNLVAVVGLIRPRCSLGMSSTLIKLCSELYRAAYSSSWVCLLVGTISIYLHERVNTYLSLQQLSDSVMSILVLCNNGQSTITRHGNG